MPPAARVSDLHVCPKIEPGPVPHVGGPLLPLGEPTVVIGGMPAAREGDAAMCVGPPDAIAKGAPTVMIGRKPAARLGDPTTHGGMVATGCPTVRIGNSPQGNALMRAGAPLVKICEPLSIGHTSVRASLDR